MDTTHARPTADVTRALPAAHLRPSTAAAPAGATLAPLT